MVANSGNIVVKGPLTGKGRSEPYVLTIRGQDQGDPPLFSDVEVFVYVGDITANDGIPSFVKPAFAEQAFVLEVIAIAIAIPFNSIQFNFNDLISRFSGSADWNFGLPRQRHRS